MASEIAGKSTYGRGNPSGPGARLSGGLATGVTGERQVARPAGFPLRRPRPKMRVRSRTADSLHTFPPTLPHALAPDALSEQREQSHEDSQIRENDVLHHVNTSGCSIG